MIPPEDAAYARGWHEGEQSGIQLGRAQARGEIAHGITQRAIAAEHAAPSDVIECDCGRRFTDADDWQAHVDASADGHAAGRLPVDVPLEGL